MTKKQKSDGSPQTVVVIVVVVMVLVFVVDVVLVVVVVVVGYGLLEQMGKRWPMAPLPRLLGWSATQSPPRQM